MNHSPFSPHFFSCLLIEGLVSLHTRRALYLIHKMMVRAYVLPRNGAVQSGGEREGLVIPAFDFKR